MTTNESELLARLGLDAFTAGSARRVAEEPSRDVDSVNLAMGDLVYNRRVLSVIERLLEDVHADDGPGTMTNLDKARALLAMVLR